MKTRLVVLISLVTSILTFGQSSSLLEQYKIPTYSFHNLSVSGQDFFNYFKRNTLDNGGSNEQVNMNFNASDNYFYQSPKANMAIQTSLTYSYFKNSDIEPKWDYEHKTEQSTGQISINTDNSWYFNDERGFFVYLESGLNGTIYSEHRPTNIFNLPLGVGYGRLITVRNVVQANIISKELGANLSDDKLLKLAEVLEKYQNGYYTSKYRDDVNIEFEKDIDAITGKPEQTSKISQILNSHYYNTAMRMKGWMVKGGVINTAGSIDQYVGENGIYRTTNNNDGTDLFFQTAYALPINLDKQLYASLAYSKNLDDKDFRFPKLKAEALFSIDHSFTWSSTISANYDMAFPKAGENLNSLKLSVKSSYNLINSFYLYGSLGYNKYNFSEVEGAKWSSLTYKCGKYETMEAHFGFNFYIF